MQQPFFRFFLLTTLAFLVLVGCGRSTLHVGPNPDASVDDGSILPDSSALCIRDADCASTPATPVCDIASGRCVECLSVADCALGDSCLDFTCRRPCDALGGCGAGETCCGAFCADTQGDVNHCGGCDNFCRLVANATVGCSGGRCGIEVCTTGYADCDGTLANGCETNLTSDALNCGGCGVRCGPGQRCAGSVCIGGTGCRFTGCGPGQTCCDDACVDTSEDPANCGGCFVACPADAPQCESGGCCTVGTGDGMCSAMVCPDGLTNCGGICVDQARDPLNCGGCGFDCAPGDSCSASACVPAGCAGGPACAPSQTCCATGCATTSSDPLNCGGCDVPCATGTTCVAGACTAPGCAGGPACAPSQTCCATGCASTSSDPLNCGGCDVPCATGTTCVAGVCTLPDEGAFNPIVNPTYLTPGVHHYTTITIPAGVFVFVAGGGPASGTLDLQASGDVRIEGTIDVSGGPGTQNTITSRDTNQGRAGSGGYTGEQRSAAASPACQFIAGNGGLNGQTAGTTGSCPRGSTTVCRSLGDPTAVLFAAPSARFGGGGGVFTGFRAYGGGGGGAAGGAPGSCGTAYPGERDCAGASGGGGATAGAGGAGGSASYSGGDGSLGQTQCPGSVPGVPAAYVGGGGGGSIGTAAATDLAALMTFQAGSGGGGGSADFLNRPVFGGTSGGGGGGGALRIASSTSIGLRGQLLANGGDGGDAFIGNGAAAGCDPQPGAAGGGGSGGLIYLQAPQLIVTAAARVSAVGGGGGFASRFASGGRGGAGGMGRVRISATPSTCTLLGSFDPPLVSGCSPTVPATPDRAYVGTYPN